MDGNDFVNLYPCYFIVPGKLIKRVIWGQKKGEKRVEVCARVCVHASSVCVGGLPIYKRSCLGVGERLWRGENTFEVGISRVL